MMIIICTCILLILSQNICSNLNEYDLKFLTMEMNYIKLQNYQQYFVMGQQCNQASQSADMPSNHSRRQNTQPVNQSQVEVGGQQLYLGQQEYVRPIRRESTSSQMNESPVRMVDPNLRRSNVSSNADLMIRSTLRRQQSNLPAHIRSRLSNLPNLPVMSRLDSRIPETTIYIEQLNATYTGELERNIPNGVGSLKFDNGDYLEGEFANGRCEGKGRFIKADGSYYEGDFRNNVADGYGRYLDILGYAYEGQWKHNLPNGKGEAIYHDDAKYNGEFLNNKKHGKGVLMQKGCIFDGHFVNNHLQGFAIMQSDNGEVYKGQWRNNQKHGQGEYTWPNGNRYKGAYRNDKREGFGRMEYSNGQFYEGYWVNGVKHGEGKYKSTKKVIKGEWKNGELVSEIQNYRQLN